MRSSATCYIVRKLKTEDVLEIRLTAVLSDLVHDMGESAALQKDVSSVTCRRSSPGTASLGKAHARQARIAD